MAANPDVNGACSYRNGEGPGSGGIRPRARNVNAVFAAACAPGGSKTNLDITGSVRKVDVKGNDNSAGVGLFKYRTAERKLDGIVAGINGELSVGRRDAPSVRKVDALLKD